LKVVEVEVLMKLLILLLFLSPQLWGGDKKYSYKEALSICTKKCAEVQSTDDQCVQRCAHAYDKQAIKSFKKKVSSTGNAEGVNRTV
jgi:hypothetical protein